MIRFQYHPRHMKYLCMIDTRIPGRWIYVSFLFDDPKDDIYGQLAKAFKTLYKGAKRNKLKPNQKRNYRRMIQDTRLRILRIKHIRGLLAQKAVIPQLINRDF